MVTQHPEVVTHDPKSCSELIVMLYVCCSKRHDVLCCADHCRACRLEAAGVCWKAGQDGLVSHSWLPNPDCKSH